MTIFEMIEESAERGDWSGPIHIPPDGTTGNIMADAYLGSLFELLVCRDHTWVQRELRLRRAIRQLERAKLLGEEATALALVRAHLWLDAIPAKTNQEVSHA